MNADREVYMAPEREIPAEDRQRLLDALRTATEETLAKIEAAHNAQHDREQQA